MSQDTQDQGTPSALRPRHGWDKSARNPEAVHGNLDPSSIPSTGYMGPSYEPVKGPMQAVSDAGELDQSQFAERQQGHLLSRTNSPGKARGADAGGAEVVGSSDPQVPADGRPAWDARFHLVTPAWEMQPRTLLLRPPSTNAFPGSGATVGSSVRRSMPMLHDGHPFSDGGSPRPRPSYGFDGLDTESGPSNGIYQVAVDGYGSRATILPGLHAISPPLRPSPYYSQPSGTGAGVVPGTGNGAPGGPQSPGSDRGASGNPAVRPVHVDIENSYVGQAYSPDQSQLVRGRGFDGNSADGSGSGGCSHGSGSRARVTDGDEADDEGGVDGQGTHLPALDRVYYRKQEPSTAAGGQPGGRPGKSPGGGRLSLNKQGKLNNTAAIPGAAYMPKTHGPGEVLSWERRSPYKTVSAPPPMIPSSRPNHSSPPQQASGGGGGGGRSDEAVKAGEHEPSGGFAAAGPIWRPSGRQAIPATVPPVPKNTRDQHNDGAEDITETQEEADRRRAAPRDMSLYSPIRYPLVGQGWFLPPEKFPPNPAYAGVRAKYMEVRPPRLDPDDGDGQRTMVHMPDIHTKPWMTPGKHLVTDSSAPPPKTTGTRPAQAVSTSTTAKNVSASALRSNSGTARSGRSGAAGRPGKGVRKQGSGSGSEAMEGDREVLAVIGGVRLMSIVRRDRMGDQAEMEAEEDASFAAEGVAAAEKKEGQARRASGGVAEDVPKGAEERTSEDAATADAEGLPGTDEGHGSGQGGPMVNRAPAHLEQPACSSSSRRSSSGMGDTGVGTISGVSSGGGEGNRLTNIEYEVAGDGEIPFGTGDVEEPASGAEEEEQDAVGGINTGDDVGAAGGGNGYDADGDADDDEEMLLAVAATGNTDEEGEGDAHDGDVGARDDDGDG